MTSPEIIFDIGMCEGNDTAFYLAKGFDVVGVEANPTMYDRLKDRFEKEIRIGRLHLLEFAAGLSSDDMITINVHDIHMGISGVNFHQQFASEYKRFDVPTIDWSVLCSKAKATPRYVKIDIEGNEQPFLSSFYKNDIRPEFISVECHEIEPIIALRDLGYKRFKIVTQNEGFVLPAIEREGATLGTYHFVHASGPFGLDLEGDWLGFDQAVAEWHESRIKLGWTWFDCHARLF